MNVNCVGVIGGGLMGCGIATRFALAGFDTVLIEADASRLPQITSTIDTILTELIDAGSIEAARRHRVHASVKIATSIDGLTDACAVIEAIPEILQAKQTLFDQLAALLTPQALILSNTSGFLPDNLFATTAGSERCLVAHFWNPPHLIPLVEVVPGSATLPAATEQTTELMRRIGAEPVVLHKAIPGFIGNRLQFALLREALHIIQTGAADAATVDAVMTASLGRRYSIMGPLEAADLGGLQTLLNVGTHLVPELSSDLQPLEVLRRQVARTELGRATGQGFYRWDAARIASLKQRRLDYLQHEQHAKNRSNPHEKNE